ncbi:hypothetical protein N0V90_002811 [Kalmusia sp. IMI 367209]|nr:hypothetical protein N0V90_002811 [Kalmusia sp. IMI 367209]
MASKQETCDPNDIRQTEEKERLLARLSRHKGAWEKRHPRHRLLDALYGYLTHHDLVSKDVNRWRTSKKSMSFQFLRTSTKTNLYKFLERTIQYSQKLNTNDHLLLENKDLQEKIVQNAMQFYGVEKTELDEHIRAAAKEGRVAEKVSVAQALKHLVRDWSTEGDAERIDAFPCVLNTLLRFSNNSRATPARVLLPGSGLGRLGHDIHGLGGFEVTLNEYSVYMNIAYRFLESLDVEHSAGLHPFIDTWSHHATTSDMQRRISFPDHPLASRSVILVEGDFTTVFKGQEETFDYIITLFFIDTARNLLAYFDTIHKLLKPGGIWINFGPLLYGSGPFVQLSLDEIVYVVEDWGFEFLDGDGSCGSVTLLDKKVRGKTAAYAFNAKALSINAYKAQSWVLRKAS